MADGYSLPKNVAATLGVDPNVAGAGAAEEGGGADDPAAQAMLTKLTTAVQELEAKMEDWCVPMCCIHRRTAAPPHRRTAAPLQLIIHVPFTAVG